MCQCASCEELVCFMWLVGSDFTATPNWTIQNVSVAFICTWCIVHPLFFLSFFFFNARLSHHFNKSQNESFLISLYVFKATESPGMRMKKGQIDRRLTLTGIGINCFTRRKQHPVLNKGVHHVLMFLFMAPAKIILNSQARQSERKCLECAVEAN